MKKLTFISAFFVILAVACSKQKSKENIEQTAPKIQKTQAYIGLKEGGEWKWVTKNNGTKQW